MARLTKEAADNLALHEKYAQQLGIDLRSVRPIPQCQAYLDLVLEVASSDAHDTAACIAVVAPYARLHAFIGRELRRRQQQQAAAGLYQEWIDPTVDAGADALAGTLEELLDTYAAFDQARSP